MTAVFCCLHAEGRLARVCAAAHRAHAPARAAAPPAHARRGLNGCKGTTKEKSTGHHSSRVDSRGAEVDRTPAPPAARDRCARRAPPDPPRLLAPAAPCRSPCAASQAGIPAVYSGCIYLLERGVCCKFVLFFSLVVQNKCFRSRIGFSCLSSLVCRKLTVVTKKNGTFSSEWHRPPGVDAGCRCGGQAPVGGRCGRMSRWVDVGRCLRDMST